ncbi:NucA/NucB deoxyribonuclease domain-containing protein [Plantactinospora sp. WMMB782]|uniref:NucA/NucB deoxyribonuclease domain-containing protein n=1 Tax=Plantactinospora sp. WMMB782 TaxID=3404121 RepID=UPI003B94E94E
MGTSTKSTTGPSVSLAAVPDWCTGTTNTWRWNRFEHCVIIENYVSMVDVVTGAQIGRTEFTLGHLIRANRDSLRFTEEISIRRGESYGVMENDDEMTARMISYCATGCSRELDSDWIPWDYEESVELGNSYDSNVGDGQIALSRITYEFWVDHEDAVGDDGWPMTYSSGDVRCDRVPYRTTAGCVTGFHVPTLSHAGLGSITQHVISAQSAGKPGRPNQSTLTYDEDDARSIQRRAAACASFTPARPGEECDEYPFAHTTQGGSNSSTASVPSSEQRAQGGKFSSFIQNLRVLSGEGFYVDPYANSHY